MKLKTRCSSFAIKRVVETERVFIKKTNNRKDDKFQRFSKYELEVIKYITLITVQNGIGSKKPQVKKEYQGSIVLNTESSSWIDGS